MLKKVLQKAKDAIYETVVEKDAEFLAKNLGNQAAIEAYLEENKVPERKTSYELLYEALVEKLDDVSAEKLYQKKFYFVERRKIAVLWEEFAEEKQKEEALKKEKETRERLEEINKQLEEVVQIEQMLKEKLEKNHQNKTTLTEEKNQLLAALGEASETVSKPTSVQEPVQQPELKKEKTETLTQKEVPVQQETIVEEMPKQQAEPSQDEIAEALYRESQLYGENFSFDPNLREEAPSEQFDVVDEIMKDF